MSYTWPLAVEPVFEERAPQMAAYGIPAEDVAAIRSRVTEMWPDAPGGWVYEWSRLAESYAAKGQSSLAALAYGYAKFPTLADEAKRTAYAHQIEHYVTAASQGPTSFRRRVVEVEHLGQTVSVTVHELAAPDTVTAQAPVLLVSGGVDGWKEDMHNLWVALATHTGMTVLAFDIPGTGESTVPMSSDGGPQIVSGLVAEARRLGDGRVAHIGISMGGYFSARTGLSGEVDAAVDLGGPVSHSFMQVPSGDTGMGGIVGNALGLNAPLPEPEMRTLWSRFSLDDLLATPQTTPMLVINGADDPLVPQHDTLLFNERAHTEVALIPDTGHCAASKVGEVMPMIIGWLARTIPADTTPTSA